MDNCTRILQLQQAVFLLLLGLVSFRFVEDVLGSGIVQAWAAWKLKKACDHSSHSLTGDVKLTLQQLQRRM
eukprot:4658421-Amphidinium_carterae.1